MSVTLAELDVYIRERVEGVKPDPSRLRVYREYTRAESFAVRLKAGEKRNLSGAVVFVEDRPRYFFQRQSMALMHHGIQTILVTRWGVSAEERDCYGQVVLYDRFEELKALAGWRNGLFYVQSWVGWSFLPVYVRLIVEGKVFCNINDLSHLIVDEPYKGALINLDDVDVSLDLRCERFILEKFDKVTLPYVKEGIRRMGDYALPDGAHIETFPCYPSLAYTHHERRELTDGLRLLFVGGIPPDDHPDEMFRDAKMHDVIEDVLGDGVEVSLLVNPTAVLSSVDTMALLYPFFTALESRCSHFSIRRGYSPKALYRYTRAFHFGLMVYSFECFDMSRQHIAAVLPSKLFTYLELGLPVIVSEELEAVCAFVEREGVGMVVSREDVKHLPDVVAVHRAHYASWVESIERYCQAHCMEHEIACLFGQSADAFTVSRVEAGGGCAEEVV